MAETQSLLLYAKLIIITLDTLYKLHTFTCQAKNLILHKKNNVAKIVNGLLFMKLFQLSIGN